MNFYKLLWVTLVMEVAEKVSGICQRLQIPYISKASYRKANRRSASSFTGIGDEAALELIKKVGEKYSIPTTKDIHAHEETALAAKYADILQIPAFLRRQTDLIIAAAETGKIVNGKKGQFFNGISIKFAVENKKNVGNEKVVVNRMKRWPQIEGLHTNPYFILKSIGYP